MTRISAPVDRRLIAISRRVEDLALLVPQAIQHQTQQLHDNDGYTTSTTGPAVTTSNTTSTVEQAALRTDAIRIRIWQIYDDIDSLGTLVNDHYRHLRRLIGHPEPIAATNPLDDALCDCRGKAGATEWGDYNCTSRPVKAGLCSACYFREYRWRRANNEPPRTAD